MSELPASLLEAMLAVQAAATTFKKDRTVTVKTKNGGEYTYSYTPLDSIVEQIGPVLAANGLVWVTKPSWSQAMGASLKYKIAHAPSKEFEEGEMPLMLADGAQGDGPDAQAMGSAITYMRRYALCAVLNLVADADDDGALAGAGGGRGSGQLASDKQKKFLRTLITQNRFDGAALRPVFEKAGVTLEEGATLNGVIDTLTKSQCSALIETIKDGAVPTGESDVPPPAEGEFQHPPQDEELFSPEVPS